MDEPTLAEMLRALQSDVRRLLDREAHYVTQEQRNADAKVYDLQVKALEKEQAEIKLRVASVTRWFWSAVVAPVIVGVVLYFLVGGKP